MDILGRVKRKTSVYSAARFDDEIIQYELEPGDEIHIYGRKTNGIHTFYKISAGDFVFSDDVQVVRDLEFYYDNYKEKKFQKNNVNMSGRGFSYILEPAKKYTSSYLNLQQFATFGPGSWTEINTTVGGGFGGAINGNRGNGPSTGIIPTIDSTMGGGLSSIGAATSANITDTFGISDSTGLLNGVTVGSLFDGSFLDTIGDNLLGAIGNWSSNKLKYVVGFDFGSGTSWLNSIFSLFFGNGNGGMPDLFSQLFGGFFNSNGSYFSNGATGGTASNGLADGGAGTAAVIERLNKFWAAKKITLTPTSQAAIKYFSYCDYIPDQSNPFYFDNSSQIIKAYNLFDDLKGGGLVLASNTNLTSTRFLKNMASSSYEEQKTMLDKVKEDLNISVERKVRFTKFNRWRIPSVDHELGNSKGYVFFSVPDMNISLPKDDVESGKTIYYDYSRPLMETMISQHSIMTKYLMGGSGGHKFIPVFTDRCTGLDMSDDVLETIEAHESRTGWKIVYGKGNIQSRTAGTVTIGFVDDNMLSIYKMLKIWTEYINAVYHGACLPKAKYRQTHVLDYAISIYYFLTDATGEDILFFSKYTGCFPTAAPASNFSDTIDSPIKIPSYSVSFSYARKDDYNPLNLAEFNHLSEGLGWDGIKVCGEGEWLAHRTFVGAPFVDTETNGYLYKLKFRQG